MTRKTITVITTLQQRLANRCVLTRIRVTGITFRFANSAYKIFNRWNVKRMHAPVRRHSLPNRYLPRHVQVSVLFSHLTSSAHSFKSCVFITLVSCRSFKRTVWRPIFSFRIQPMNPVLVPMFSNILKVKNLVSSGPRTMAKLMHIADHLCWKTYLFELIGTYPMYALSLRSSAFKVPSDWPAIDSALSTCRIPSRWYRFATILW